MSFERTGNSIRNLSRGNISLEEMLEMLVCVKRDVFEVNGIKKVSAMKSNDPEQVLLKMNSLMEMLLQIYKANQKSLKKFEDEEFEAEIAETSQRVERLQHDFSDIAAKLAHAKDELTKAENDVTQQELKLAKVKKERDAAREAAANVTKKTQEFQAEIAQATQLIENADKTESEILEKQMKLTVLLNALDSMKNDDFLAEKLYACADAEISVAAKADLAVAGKRLDSWTALESWMNEMVGRIDGLTTVLSSVQQELANRAQHLTDKTEQK